MATEQTRTGTKSRSGSRNPAAAAPSSRALAATKHRDEFYGLVSVLYHALQGAETYAVYVEDARKAGDRELAEFFEECQDEESDRAERAKELLAARIDALADESDDEDDEASDEDDEDDEPEQ
jgi:hypothetical protein